MNRAVLGLSITVLGAPGGWAGDYWLIGGSSGTGRGWSPDVQRLSTRLVVTDGRDVVVAGEWEGLILPTNGSFRKFGIVRACSNLADNSSSECRDRLWRGTLAEAIPTSAVYPASGSAEICPCSYDTLVVTFGSTDLLSFWSYSGASESCNPRGWQWRETAWVESGEQRPLSFSELGEGTRKAYASAALLAEANWIAEWDGQRPAECYPNVEESTGWYIRSDGARPRPWLFQQTDSAICQFEARIDFEMTEALLGRHGRPPQRVLHVVPGETIASTRLSDPEATALLQRMAAPGLVPDSDRPRKQR